MSLASGGFGSAFHTQLSSTFLWITHDGGATWEPRLAPPIGDGQVRFADEGFGIAHGPNGALFRSTDAGRTWDELPGPTPGDEFAVTGSLALSDAGDVVAVAGDSQHDVEDFCDPRDDLLTVYRSVDRGERRKGTGLGVSAHTYAMDFFDTEHGVITRSEIDWQQTGDCSWTGRSLLADEILVTRDGGQTFEKVFACDPSCTAVAMPAPGRVVIGDAGGRVYVTDRDGITLAETHLPSLLLEPLGSLDALWVQDIDFVDQRIGYATTNGRGIWRTDDGGAAWTRELSTQDAFGIGIGEVAAAADGRVIAGGPTFVLSRLSA